ncbi:RNA polymerase sigma factor [Stieleria varia]|uniref:RNA polymerase sigma factor n=1 Tax=Stieleria varia TaxID=2528005 RepID=A0A5C6BA93_9BACT|nr:RNA polymerase sigma factor [Stieleria varia]TWU08199.1 ECF RNA polymerase sigma factor SigE [Stieleria varia]
MTDSATIPIAADDGVSDKVHVPWKPIGRNPSGRNPIGRAVPGATTSADPCVDPVAMDQAWIEDHYPIVHRAAWTMTGDVWAAEDLAQETFVVALDCWNGFQGRSSRLTWLYGILLRLRQRRSRTLSRLQRRIETYAGLRPPQRAPDPIDEQMQTEWNASVWSLVRRLPKRQADAVTLRFAQQLTYQEIADAAGCSLGTAKSRVHEGLKKLRAHPECHDLMQQLSQQR